MGGGQANKQQANAADAGASRTAVNAGNLSNIAQQSADKLQPQADRYGAERQQLYNTLWGDPTQGTPRGSLTGMLDPNSLNTTAPTGSYAYGLTQANEQLAKDSQDAVAATRRDAANRGFPMGSGAQSDAELKARLGTADIKGRNYGAALEGTHGEALNNFWNSVQAAQGDKAASQQGQTSTQAQQGTSTGQAITGNQGASQTYGQLYGTAGAYHPSAATGIAQSAIGAAGAVGGGAMSCVCEGTQILMDDETFKRIENLRPRDRIRSRDGRHDEVIDVDVIPETMCYLLATGGREFLRASGSHTLERPGGGYINVSDSMGAKVSTRQGPQHVTELSGIGKRTVYKLRLKYAHVYLSANFWSLE